MTAHRGRAEGRDWTEYGPLEGRLFEDIGRAEARLIARDFAHQFKGETLAYIEDATAAIYTAASNWLASAGLRHVFGEAHLWAKAESWARHWLRFEAAQYRGLEHPHFTAEAAARGRQRSLALRTTKADRRAVFVQQQRAKGWSVREIARFLGLSTRHVFRLVHRTVSDWLTVALTFGKDSVRTEANAYHFVTAKSAQRLASDELPDCFAKCEAQPLTFGPDRGRRNAAEDGEGEDVQAIGANIPEILRAYWSETQSAG